jgi:hypothetical protein
MSNADRVAAFLRLAQEIREGVDPARIHAIGRLAAELPKAHPLRLKLMALDRLSVYAAATRYPSPTGKLPRAPNLAVIEMEIGAVAELLDRARSHLVRHRR